MVHTDYDEQKKDNKDVKKKYSRREIFISKEMTNQIHKGFPKHNK